MPASHNTRHKRYLRAEPTQRVDSRSYLSRLGLSPADVADPTVESLQRLQTAHVSRVPFENLAIVGDPVGESDGGGVSLALPALYEKIVDRGRGGFCFELNGLFGWLLDDRGFDATRLAARILDADGTARPPANHHTHSVSLDRRYLVDVGLGVPPMRRPLPFDGTPVTDAVGVSWRIVESDRSDADFLVQFHNPGGEEWSDRYVFTDEPRDLRFFEATCEYLANAPESHFTGGPIVSCATDDGYRKLSGSTLTTHENGETTERDIDENEFAAVLDSVFGIDVATIRN